MTLQELLDPLTALQPASACDATVVVHGDYEDYVIIDISYDKGEVLIRVDDRETDE